MAKLKANTNSCVGDIYGVIIELKEEYDDNNINWTLFDFIDERLKEYIKEAKEWLVEDNRETYEEENERDLEF